MAMMAQQLGRVWFGLAAALLLSSWLGGCGAARVAAPPDAYGSVASLLAVVEGRSNPMRTLRMVN